MLGIALGIGDTIMKKTHDSTFIEPLVIEEVAQITVFWWFREGCKHGTQRNGEPAVFSDCSDTIGQCLTPRRYSEHVYGKCCTLSSNRQRALAHGPWCSRILRHRLYAFDYRKLGCRGSIGSGDKGAWLGFSASFVCMKKAITGLWKEVGGECSNYTGALVFVLGIVSG